MKEVICAECGCCVSTEDENCPCCGEDMFPDGSSDEDDATPKKYSNCAECGEELGEEYLMYADNFLQVKYFDREDGSDNAFCSEACAGQSLMLATAENKPGSGYLFV